MERSLALTDDWRWKEGRAAVGTQLTYKIGSNGEIMARLFIHTSAEAFKMHAKGRAYAVFLDHRGNVIGYDHERWRPLQVGEHSMAMTRKPDYRQTVNYWYIPKSCDVAYIALGMNFCAFQQNFARNQEASYCPGGGNGLEFRRESNSALPKDAPRIARFIQSQNLPLFTPQKFEH